MKSFIAEDSFWELFPQAAVGVVVVEVSVCLSVKIIFSAHAKCNPFDTLFLSISPGCHIPVTYNFFLSFYFVIREKEKDIISDVFSPFSLYIISIFFIQTCR